MFKKSVVSLAWMVAGANGLDVYVGFSMADNYMVTSHDGGMTWSDPIKTNTDRRYFFPESAVVLPDGTIVWTSPTGHHYTTDPGESPTDYTATVLI